MTRVVPPLEAYRSDWPAHAAQEIARWQAQVPGLVAVHHIGSTSVPGLIAKPILDLLPVFETTETAQAAQPFVEAFGYEWMGSYGLVGRFYVRRNDPDTGRRVVQVHGYAEGHPDIRRHLAFRDLLRQRNDLREAYAALKTACAECHSEMGAAYGDCKSAWIDAMERTALEVFP